MQKFILALALATAPVRHPRATQKFNLAGGRRPRAPCDISTMAWRPTIHRTAPAQVGVDSMGYSSPGCVGELVAEIEPYTGDEAKAGGPYTSEVTGMACVSTEGSGIIFIGSLSGLEPSKLDIGGFHIHSGGSCDDNTSQGGHYWSDKVPACGVTTDPWTAPQGATYSTTSDGDAAPVNIMPGLSATGGVTGFTTSADESECGVAGKTVIIHREDGTRVGCGILM
jgi:Cu/Zn superoxide dismutase